MPATLRAWLQVTALALAVGISIAFLGLAKVRKSEDQKIASIVLILAAVAFQVVMFALLGSKLGFVSNVYRFNLASIVSVYLPTILLITAGETLRGQMIDKGQRSRGVIILTTFTMSFLVIAVNLPLYLPLAAQGFFDLVMTVAFPAILTNILLTYIAYYYDFRANIAYRLIMELPILILPIYPDTNHYLTTLLTILLTAILIVGFVGSKKWGEQPELRIGNQRQKIKRPLPDYQKKLLRNLKYVATGIGIFALVSFVALMSGLFKYHFLAVGSDSMKPALSRGDLVIVEKTNRYDQIVEGDVLVYRHEDVIIVHRVAAIEVNGQTYRYRTRGDANKSGDIWQVEQGDIIGVQKQKSQCLGFRHCG